MNKIIPILWFTILTHSLVAQTIVDKYGAIVRSDTTTKNIYLCFTGHDYDEGFVHVLRVLGKHHIPASFFLTGDFVREHKKLVKQIDEAGHYVGAHSDKHLLYCDWVKRDSLLHTPAEIKRDIQRNLQALAALDIHPTYFMPPYEWYNRAVVEIASALDQITVNFSPGTRSNADYTIPEMANYVSSATILESIYGYEAAHGMGGFHLLIHPGTSPQRRDKLYLHLEELIGRLKEKGYGFGRFE